VIFAVPLSRSLRVVKAASSWFLVSGNCTGYCPSRFVRRPVAEESLSEGRFLGCVSVKILVKKKLEKVFVVSLLDLPFNRSFIQISSQC
jgi:hypothetical protein